MARTRCQALTHQILALFVISLVMSVLVINADDDTSGVGVINDKLLSPPVADGNTGKQQQEQQKNKDAGSNDDGTLPPLPKFEEPKGVVIDPVKQPDDQVTNDPDVQTIEPSTIDDTNWLFGPMNNKNDTKSAKNDDHDANTATVVPSGDVIRTTTNSVDGELKRLLDEMDRKIDAFKNQPKTNDSVPEDRQIEAQVPPRAQDQGQSQGQAGPPKSDQWVPMLPSEDQSGRPMIQPPDFTGEASSQSALSNKTSNTENQEVSKALDKAFDYLDLLNNISKILTSDDSDSKSAAGASSVTSDDNVEATAVPLMKQDMDPFGNMFKSFNGQPNNVPQPDQTRDNAQSPQDKQVEKIWVITDNGENIRPLQLSIDNSKNGNGENNTNASNQGRPLPPLPAFIVDNIKRPDEETFPDMDTPGPFPIKEDMSGPFPDGDFKTPGPFPDVDIKTPGPFPINKEDMSGPMVEIKTPGPFPGADILPGQFSDRDITLGPFPADVDLTPGPFPIANQQQKINDSDLFSLFSLLFPDSNNKQKNGFQKSGDHQQGQLPKAPSSNDGITDPSQINPIFCKAKCMQSCMDTDGNSMHDCDMVCTDVTANDLCASNDQVCQKACSSSPISNEFNAPNVTDVKYFTMGEVVDPETVEVSWDPLSGATLYIIDFIPNSRSVESGSFIVKEDITNVPWYSFKKDDLCYEYYVRVAAVYKDGITPYSVPKFLKGAFTTHPLNFKVDVGEISAPEVTLFDRDGPETTTFAQVDMELFSLQHMDLSKLELSSYVLASDCKNRPDDSQDLGEPVQNGKYKVGAAQFLYIDQAISMRLPVKFASYDCKYEYRIASVKTRCGDVVSFTSSSGQSYDSTIGADFRLNCGNVPYDGCKVGTNPPLTPSNDEDNDADQQQQMTTNATPLPNCDMTGFTADVIGNMFDKFNVTISWDALNDMTKKTYVVRHGVAHRHLIVPSEFEMTFDPEDDIRIFDDGKSQVDQKSVKLNRPLNHNELHVFQICALYDTSRDSDLIWELVPKHVLDMAAFPTPTLDTVPKSPNPDSDSSSNDNTAVAGAGNSNLNLNMNPNTDWYVSPDRNVNLNVNTNMNQDNSNLNKNMDQGMNPDTNMNLNSNPDTNMNMNPETDTTTMKPFVGIDDPDFVEAVNSQKQIVDPPAAPSNGDDGDFFSNRQKIVNPNTDTSTNLNTNTKSEYEAAMLGRSLQMSWFLLATALFSFFCFLVVVVLLLVRYNGNFQKGVKKFGRPRMPQFLIRRTPSMKKPILEDVDIEKVSIGPETPEVQAPDVHSQKPQANDHQPQADHKQPQI